MQYRCYINNIEVIFSTFLQEIKDSSITAEQMAEVMEGCEYSGKYGLIFKINIVND